MNPNEQQPNTQPNSRGQLTYPLDLQSEGALKSSLENILKDVIVRSNRIQTTLLAGVTNFNVASSYMVMTAQAGVTIATIGGGREGMILTLQFTDANITITDTSTGAENTVNLNEVFTSAANDVIQLLHDGISWREVSRGTGGLVTTTNTVTLTNKRITPRVTSETSSATPTINTDNSDAHSITALATAITSMTTNLSGTPTNFQALIIRIKDNGTARAITWGASFEDAGQPLPTTTVLSKLLTVGFIYNTVTSKWGCVAVANET